MTYFLCYLAIFISIIVIIELIMPDLRGTSDQVHEDFETLKQIALHSNSSARVSLIIAILVYLFIIHILTILTLSGIEWLAKVL